MSLDRTQYFAQLDAATNLFTFHGELFSDLTSEELQALDAYYFLRTTAPCTANLTLEAITLVPRQIAESAEATLIRVAESIQYPIAS